MVLTVNGELYTTDCMTVIDLLRELRIVPETVAVEVNLSIVRRKDFSTSYLHEGDSVEIVNFVGGG